MTDKEFWSSMENVRKCADNKSPRPVVLRLGTEIFSEYIGEKTRVSRSVIEPYLEYIGFHRQTMEEALKAEQIQISRKNKKLIRKHRETMLHIRAGEGFIPIPVNVPKVEDDFLDLITGTTTVEKKVKLFKYWLLNAKLRYTEEDGYPCFYVNEAEWALLNARMPKMIKRLLDEGKEFYSRNGYFAAIEETNAFDELVKNALANMTEEEKKSVVRLIKGDRRVTLV